jgi:SAM-dependent methyltransferase
VAVTLRVAERMEEGAAEIGELAAACGADTDALGRVLRHLAGKGVFEEPAPGRFLLNDAARGLMDSGFRLGLDLDSFGGRMAHAWSTLLPAVRTGKPAFHEVFGRPFWEDLEAHPEISERFDALIGPEGHGIPDPRVLLNPDDWKWIKTVVDIGGGTGSLLAEVLRAHPDVRGILVDLPGTVARSAKLFEAAGVADRASAIGQSFFEPLPAGADVYLMKSVLSDWPDTEASRLLRSCAAALGPSGRLVLLGEVSPGERASPELLMLVLLGGRTRTFAEFRTMATGAGLEVRASGRLPSGRFAVECGAAKTAS